MTDANHRETEVDLFTLTTQQLVALVQLRGELISNLCAGVVHFGEKAIAGKAEAKDSVLLQQYIGEAMLHMAQVEQDIITQMTDDAFN